MTEVYVILITVLAFLIMISLHEFGHFIFGKLLGFDVVEYAIGFGPAIFKKQGKKTLYSVRIVPFGGFCRFSGEDEETEGVPGAFNEQKPWKRIIVLAAGAVFNVLLGFVLFIFLTLQQGTAYTNRVDTLVEGTQLYQSGVQSGDEIVKIDGKNINFYNDIRLYTQNLSENESVDITVKRDGKKYDYTVKPTKRSETVEYKNDAIYYTSVIGDKTQTQIIPYSDTHPYNEEKLGSTENYTGLLLGFTPVTEKVTAGNLFSQSFNYTRFVVKLVYKSLGDLITGKVGMDQMSGPVGIVDQVNSDADAGYVDFAYILNLVALLTINLGVMNLLPIPALDGGRLLFVIFELIFRKPVPRDKEGLIHAIGFMLLIGLMIFVFFQDIWKLFH